MIPWIDVTRLIRPGMPVWPEDPTVEREAVASIAAGDECNVGRWTLGSHSGTHVDAPLHYIPHGAPVNGMSLDGLIGPCVVVSCEGAAGHINEDDLRPFLLTPPTRVLFKTRNSHADPAVFHDDFAALTEGAALALLQAGVRLIGIDGPSVEPFEAPGHPVHQALLGAGVAIIENLYLASVAPGRYDLICAPMLLDASDGAPARVLLRPLGA